MALPRFPKVLFRQSHETRYSHGMVTGIHYRNRALHDWHQTDIIWDYYIGSQHGNKASKSARPEASPQSPPRIHDKCTASRIAKPQLPNKVAH